MGGNSNFWPIEAISFRDSAALWAGSSCAVLVKQIKGAEALDGALGTLVSSRLFHPVDPAPSFL